MKKKTSPSKLTKNRELPTTKNFITFFTIFFFANIFICTVLAVASGGDSWQSMLFHNGSHTDLFMDFFNSIRDGGSEDVYSGRNNIYPPLCVLIFRLFSKMIKPSLVSSIFENRKALLADQLSVMIYFIFTLICILTMLRLIESYSNSKTLGKNKMDVSIFSFMMIISYPVIFCVERGNILILSVVFAMFFIFFKDSEKKVIRELSYIALAFSAGIKIYPAIFGLSLIIEKKYKEAARLVLYGIIVVVFPIVFFLDFGSSSASILSQTVGTIKVNALAITDTASSSSSMIAKLIENLLSFATTKKSTLNLSSVSIKNFVFLFDVNAQITAKILCGITEVMALVAAFFAKKEWQRVFLLCYIMLNIPSASSSYALSFLIIPFSIFLFGTNNYKKKDWVYTSCFALLLTPLPTLWYYHATPVLNFFKSIGVKYNSQLNQDIATFVFQFMFFFITAEIIASIVNSKRKKPVTADNVTLNDANGEEPDSDEEDLDS